MADEDHCPAQEEIEERQGSTLPDFSSFRAQFPIRSMSLDVMRYKNDCAKIEDENDLIDIEHPARQTISVTNQDADGNVNSEEKRYLWAITAEKGLQALEKLGERMDVGGGKIKHSNLTEGNPAHGGGELWYWRDKNTIVINAASGRYGYRGHAGVEMAQAAVAALRVYGFNAATSGIESETNSLRTYIDPEADLDF